MGIYDEKVRELANARQEIDECAADVADIEAKIEGEFPDYAIAQAALRAAKGRAKTIEESLRAVIVNRVQCFGEEPDHPALGLRRYSGLVYNAAIALEWAVDHRLYRLLDLNTEAFEAVAEVLYGGPIEVKETVQGTIKKDLAEWAGEPEGESVGA